MKSQRALDEGPQIVTRHGVKAVVNFSTDEYRRLTEKQPDFLEFLLSGPDLSSLDLDRSPETPKDIEQ